MEKVFNADKLTVEKRKHKVEFSTGIDTASANGMQDSGNINRKVGPSFESDSPSLCKKNLDGLAIICFGHLRWNFVFQRTQHLLTRFSKQQRVYFIEKPIEEEIKEPYLSKNSCFSQVQVCVPHLPCGLWEEERNETLRNLLDDLISTQGINDFISWYCTPMALPFSKHLKPDIVVYDCTNELSGIKGVHPQFLNFEEELFRTADVVFTGGMNLYEFKRAKHSNIHGVPSSIDREHFSSGQVKSDPVDQENIPHPRIGFYGVIDERLNIELISGVADLLPDWQLVMIGPVVKIDPVTLPKQKNIHYLGKKDYKELPCYLGNWEVAMLPYILNDSTRFSSPVKIPEYLAAGKPVVSTSITDVVLPFGDMGIVYIADTVEMFAEKIKFAYAHKENEKWKKITDRFLSEISWDKTYQCMYKIIDCTFENKNKPKIHRFPEDISEKDHEMNSPGWVTRLEQMFSKNVW